MVHGITLQLVHIFMVHPLRIILQLKSNTGIIQCVQLRHVIDCIQQLMMGSVGGGRPLSDVSTAEV